MYAATYSIYPLNIGYFSHVRYYDIQPLLYKSETVHMHRDSESLSHVVNAGSKRALL